jgi:hypothetical protein
MAAAAHYLPGYVEQIADDLLQILGLDALTLAGGWEANDRPASTVAAARDEDNSLLEQREYIQSSPALHGVMNE